MIPWLGIYGFGAGAGVGTGVAGFGSARTARRGFGCARQALDHAAQRDDVPQVDHFGWRMRVSERPSDGNVDRAVADELAAVVAAVGRAHLDRDSCRARDRHHAIPLGGRRGARVVERSDDRARA